MALDRRIRFEFQRCEEFARSVDAVEPSLRAQTKLSAERELQHAVELLSQTRASLDVPRFGSAELVKSRELLVIAAEGAVTNQRFDLARARTREFFLLHPPKDQFYARCLFTLAACDAHDLELAQVNGSKQTSESLKAINHLLEALDIALENSPRYDFLVVNASIFFWKIVRPMLREGGARYAVQSLSRMSDALEKIDDHDRAWRVTLLSALSLAEVDAGKLDSAASRLETSLNHCLKLVEASETAKMNDIEDLRKAEASVEEAMKALRTAETRPISTPQQIEKPSSRKGNRSKPSSRQQSRQKEEESGPTVSQAKKMLSEAEQIRVSRAAGIEKGSLRVKRELKRLERVLIQCVHMASYGEKSAAAKKLHDTAAAHLNGEKFGSRGAIILSLQRIRSRILKNADALTELKNLFSTLESSGQPVVEEKDDEVESKVAALKGPDAEFVAEIGLLAMDLSNQGLSTECVPLAMQCEKRANSAKDMSPTGVVKLDYLKCQLLLQEFEERRAVHQTELLSVSGVKEVGTKLAQQLMTTQAATRGQGPEAIDLLATQAMKLTKQTLVAKVDEKKVTAVRLRQRVEALKTLERSLLSCQRLLSESKRGEATDSLDSGVEPLLTQGCILVWNVALPLLQSHLRKHVHRAFSIAAQLLAAVGSPLQELRAKLHYELANCETATDFLAKAAEHLEASRLCDYGLIDASESEPPLPSAALLKDLKDQIATTVTDVQDELKASDDEGAIATLEHENERRRPLDAFVLPDERKLYLKKSIYKEPELVEERTLLLIEQAKDMTNTQLQLNMLRQAAGLLEASQRESDPREEDSENVSQRVMKYASLEKPATPAGKSKEKTGKKGQSSSENDSHPPPRLVTKLRTRLWYDIMISAWRSSRDVTLVHKAADFILGVTWDPVRYAPFVALQVEVQYTLAQSFVYMIEALPSSHFYAEDETVIPDESLTEVELAAREKELKRLKQLGLILDGCPVDVERLKGQVVGAISRGLHIALALATDGADVGASLPDFDDNIPKPSSTAVAYRYLVENGAILLWNLHLHIFREEGSVQADHEGSVVLDDEQPAPTCIESVTDELIQALEFAEKGLRLVHCSDSLLLSNLGEVLCLALEAKGKPSDAETVARRNIAKCRPLHAKSLVKARARMIAEKKTNGGSIPNLAKKDAKKSTFTQNDVDEDEVFHFDESSGPPSVDEVSMAQTARATHFDVIMSLEVIRVAGSGNTAVRAELDKAIAAMKEDTIAQQQTLRSAAKLAAYKVHRISKEAGGGSVGALAAAQMLPKVIMECRGELTCEQDMETLELRAELWTRLAMEALAQKDTRLAQFCCKSSLELVGSKPSKELLDRVSGGVWRWWSVSERVWAQAIHAMISPAEQEKQTQDDLSCAALEHLVKAARCSVQSHNKHTLLHVLVALAWDLSMPLMNSAASRKRLHPLIDSLLESVSLSVHSDRSTQVIGYDQELLMRLFVLLFECLADQERWKEGLGKTKKSFKLVSTEFQRPLWQWRVVFQSKLGMSALDGMAKMKESNPIMQAKVWSALGHASSDRRQQLLAHTKALELLEKDQAPERAEFLLDFGEWCLSVGLPRSDCESALLNAVDVWLDIDEDTLLAQHEVPEPDHQSRADVRSSHDTARSRSEVRSNHGGGSVHGSERSQKDGKAVKSTQALISALTVPQMDGLIRSLSMLASLSGSSNERRQRCLQAVYYAQRLLDCLITALNVWKAEQAFAAMPGERREEFATAMGLEVKRFSSFHFTRHVLVDHILQGDASIFSASTTVPGGPYIPVPSNFAMLASFEWTEDLLQSLQGMPPHLADFSCCPRSFSKLPLTFHHLSELTRMLLEEGCALQCLPVCAVSDLLARLAMDPPLPPLITLSALRHARVRYMLSDASGAERVLCSAPAIGLSSEEAEKYVGEVDLMEQSNQRDDGKETAVSVIAKQRAEAWKLRGFDIRDVWSKLALECLDPCFLHARATVEYLHFTERHNRAFHDKRNESVCAMVKARVLTLQGKFSEASDMILTAHALWRREAMQVKGSIGSMRDWCESIVLLSQLVSSETERERILSQTMDVLRSRVKRATSRDEAESGLSRETSVTAVHGFCAVGFAYCDFLLQSACSHRSAVPPCRSTPQQDSSARREALKVWDRQTNTAVGLLHEMREYCWMIGDSSMLLGRVHLSLAESYQRIGQIISEESGGFPIDSEWLSHVVEHSMEAVSVFQDVHHPLTPPEDQLAFLSTPLSRMLAQAQLVGSKAHHSMAISQGEHHSQRLARIEYDKHVTDLVTRWIDATAPPSLPVEADVPISHLDAALVLASGCEQSHTIRSEDYLCRSQLCLGECLAHIARRSGSLDHVWEMPHDDVSHEESLSHEDDVTTEKSDEVASQAGQKLKDAVVKGITIGDWESVGEAAHYLVELHGLSQPREAVKWLLLHQSCVSRGKFAKVLHEALDPTTSLATTLRQIQPYSQDDVTHGCPESHPVRIQARTFLEYSRSIPWKRLECSRDTVEAVKCLPSGVWALSLQLSPHKDGIYISLVDREGLETPSDEHPAIIWKQPLSQEEWVSLMGLCDRMGAWQQALARFLTKYGDDMGADGDFYTGTRASIILGDEKIEARLRDESEKAEERSQSSSQAGSRPQSKQKQRSRSRNETAAEEDSVSEPKVSHLERAEIDFAAGMVAAENTFKQDALEKELVQIIEEMDLLLSAALEAGTIASQLDQVVETGAELMLLPDHDIIQLPLDWLASLRRRHIRPISRDFSIHTFAHRFASSEESEASSVQVRHEDTSVICDPRHEDRGSSNTANPRSGSLEVLSSVRSKISATAQWKCVEGSSRIPSSGEWQSMLRTSGAFIFYGPGDCLSHLRVRHLAGLSSPNCRLAILCDRAENEVSFRRKSKEDSQKRAAELQLERPLETAILFTLMGVSSIVLNQWASSFYANARVFQTVIEGVSQSEAGGVATAVEQFAKFDESVSKEQSTKSRPTSKGGKGKTSKSTSSQLPAAQRSPLTQDARSPKLRVMLNPVVYGIPSTALSTKK